MAQLLVRNLQDALVAELKRRAVKNGHSVEAEHRAILHAALAGGETASLKELLAAIPAVGTEADFARTASKRRRARS